jgi:uncharacterized protein (TIGR02453 family)
MTFTGIPKAAVRFFEELEQNNNKTWWDANKATYASAVKGPLEALCESLGAYGPFHVFRLHNDMRFSKNKPPYKTHQGAVAHTGRGIDYYIGLDAAGLRVGAGMYMMATDQLQSWRSAVDDERTGQALDAAVEGLRKLGFEVSAFDALKTAPKGWPKDHPRVELLRMKGIGATRELGFGPWLNNAKARDKVDTTFRETRSLCEWLATNVGPSTLPPPPRR